MSGTNYQKRKKSAARRQQANIYGLRMAIADLRESLSKISLLANKTPPDELGGLVRSETASALNETISIAHKHHCYRR